MTGFISSVSEFASTISRFSDHSTLYRGVSKSEYALIPSIGRENFKLLNTLPESTLQKFEKDLILLFQANSYQHLRHNNLPLLELLAFGQHHGFKTRLLDWTKSALAALFFAVEKNPNDNGKVFLFKSRSHKYLNSDSVCEIKDLADINQNSMFIPLNSTPRINVQQGLFMVFDKPNEPYENDKITYIEIHHKDKPKIQKEFYLLGINNYTLFPDIDGITKFLNWEKYNN